MRLQSLSMPGEEHLILGSVCPDIAVELKQRIPCVLWQHALDNGVQVQATARHTKGKMPPRRAVEQAVSAARMIAHRYLYAAPLTLQTAVAMDCDMLRQDWVFSKLRFLFCVMTYPHRWSEVCATLYQALVEVLRSCTESPTIKQLSANTA